MFLLRSRAAAAETAGAGALGNRNGCGADDQHAAHFDLETFSSFAPLLEASDDYARLSGCRFRKGSFDGLRATSEKRSEGPRGDVERLAALMAGQDYKRLVAKLRAEPVVRDFGARLGAQEPDQALAAELERAVGVASSEGIRNCMIAICRELELWPPSPTPADVAADDCLYDDVSAPVPHVAQRLYNDHKRRELWRQSNGGSVLPCRRAATAAFLLDFANEQGVVLPPQPEGCMVRLREFMARASEWQRQQHAEARRWAPDVALQQTEEMKLNLHEEPARSGTLDIIVRSVNTLQCTGREK